MTFSQVNAAEAAIYSLSAAGFMLLIVAAFFIWHALQRHGDDAHSKAAE